MRPFSSTLSLAACGLFLVLASTAWQPTAGDPFTEELARLEQIRDHAAPGSATQYKAEHKIDRIERHLAGEPGFEAPEQFARILNEMRIPADRTEPEYTAGYRVREHVIVGDVIEGVGYVLTVWWAGMDFIDRLPELEPELMREAELMARQIEAEK